MCLRMPLHEILFVEKKPNSQFLLRFPDWVLTFSMIRLYCTDGTTSSTVAATAMEPRASSAAVARQSPAVTRGAEGFVKERARRRSISRCLRPAPPPRGRRGGPGRSQLPPPCCVVAATAVTVTPPATAATAEEAARTAAHRVGVRPRRRRARSRRGTRHPWGWRERCASVSGRSALPSGCSSCWLRWYPVRCSCTTTRRNSGTRRCKRRSTGACPCRRCSSHPSSFATSTRDEKVARFAKDR